MVAVLLVIIIGGVIFFSHGSIIRKYQKQLKLGNKCLLELSYNQACAAYMRAIEIDPKSVDAYLGMADVYIAMEEYLQWQSQAEIYVWTDDLTSAEEVLNRMREIFGAEHVPLGEYMVLDDTASYYHKDMYDAYGRSVYSRLGPSADVIDYEFTYVYDDAGHKVPEYGLFDKENNDDADYEHFNFYNEYQYDVEGRVISATLTRIYFLFEGTDIVSNNYSYPESSTQIYTSIANGLAFRNEKRFLDEYGAVIGEEYLDD